MSDETVLDPASEVRRIRGEALAAADELFRVAGSPRDEGWNPSASLGATFAYIVAGLLGEVERRHGADAAAVLAWIAEECVVDGDQEGLNDDLRPRIERSE